MLLIVLKHAYATHGTYYLLSRERPKGRGCDVPPRVFATQSLGYILDVLNLFYLVFLVFQMLSNTVA
jgi:hypothetical protein